MKQLTVPAELSVFVDPLKQPLEIRDGDGPVLGVLTPNVIVPEEVSSGWTEADLQEAERIVASNPKGLPLHEVWERIRELDRKFVALFRQLQEPTEICGETGNVIGVYRPSTPDSIRNRTIEKAAHGTP